MPVHHVLTGTGAWGISPSPWSQAGHISCHPEVFTPLRGTTADENDTLTTGLPLALAREREAGGEGFSRELAKDLTTRRGSL